MVHYEHRGDKGMFARGPVSAALRVHSHHWKPWAGAGTLLEDPVPCLALMGLFSQSFWQSISLLTCGFAAIEGGDVNCEQARMD